MDDYLHNTTSINPDAWAKFGLKDIGFMILNPER
jgi:hypothetical protein